MGNYKLPVYTNANTTKSGEPFSEHITNETVYVHNSMGALYGMPDMRYRVKIKGLEEIDAHSEIEKITQFKVDYKHTGTIYFHPEFKEKSVTVISYYSRGLQYFPASRVWTKIDSLGNVIQTLDGVIELLENIEVNKAELQNIIDYAEQAIQEGHRVMVDMYNSIDSAKEIRGNLETLIQNSKQQTLILNDLIKDIKELEESLSGLKEMVEIALKLKEDLSVLYDQSVQVSDKLEKQQPLMEQLSVNLDKMIPLATEINTNLKETISGASLALDELKNATQTGVQLHEKLVAEQDSGGKLLQQLNNLNTSVAENVEKYKQELQNIYNKSDELIKKGIKTIEDLTPIVSDGEELLKKLQAIIEGTDFEEIIAQMHEHNNKDILDKITANSEGRLEYDGVSVGIRVFTQKEQPDLKDGDQWHREIV